MQCCQVHVHKITLLKQAMLQSLYFLRKFVKTDNDSKYLYIYSITLLKQATLLSLYINYVTLLKQAMLPSLPQYMIALLKILLAAAPTSKVMTCLI